MADNETKFPTRGDVLVWQVNAECRPDEQTLLNIIDALLYERDAARATADRLSQAYTELDEENNRLKASNSRLAEENMSLTNELTVLKRRTANKEFDMEIDARTADTEIRDLKEQLEALRKAYAELKGKN